MNQLLNKALKAVRELPDEQQDEIARLMLHYAGQGEPEEIDPDHLPSVLEGLGQARRRELATDEEVAAVFRRFGP